ncbi:MAG: integrase [Peptococcaceae bacterium BRH_c4b]|nr:MAG: integrase [Peptococcaceae bacterium BRH_c4b]
MKEKYWIIEHEKLDPQTKNIANEFLRCIKLSKKSPGTIDKYRRILQKFFTECPKPLHQLVPDDVLNWLRTFYGDRKERTNSMALAVLSSFFKFCHAEEYIDRALIKNRWRPRLPKSLPKYLNSSELARVKLQAEKLSVRDRALVQFLLTSGCRRSEVSGLNVEDVDLDSRIARVVGKGNKVREVHFDEETALLLKEYLYSHPDKKPLFLNKFGDRLMSKGIYAITTRLGKKAGLANNFSPHCCRHTFATNMMSRGADLEFIGNELGHRDLNTTRIYARIPSEELIASYRKIKE